MLSFFIQSIFLFLVVIFQISFLNVVFSGVFVTALLATAVALILARGFFASWLWIVFLGIIFDILSMNVIGMTSIILILCAYGISFLSRRFLVEHRASGTGLAVLFVALSSLMYLPLLWMLRYFILGAPLSGDNLRLYFSTTHLVLGMVANAILFLALYTITLRITHALDFYDDRVIVKR